MILPIILSVSTVSKTKQIIIFQQTTSLDYYSVCPTGLRKADISPQTITIAQNVCNCTLPYSLLPHRSK